MKQFLSLCLCLLMPVNLLAQQAAPAKEWARMLALPPQQVLLVETKSNQKIKGKFVSATEAALTLERRYGKAEFARDQIKRVYRLTGTTRGRSALKGLAIGAAAGLGAGLILYLPARDDLEASLVPGFTLLGAGIGAGIAALFGKDRQRVLVYASE